MYVCCRITPAGFVSGTIELGVCYLAYKFRNVRVYLLIVCVSLTIMC